MNENTEGVTQRLASLIGHREGPKTGLDKPLVSSGKLLEAASIVKDTFASYMKIRKYERGQLTEEDMEAVTEKLKTMTENSAALGQGIHEREMAQVVNPKKATPLREEYMERLNTPIEIPTADSREGLEVERMDIVQEIANAENSVYDSLMSDELQKRKLKSIDQAGPEAARIKQETERRMDDVVRDIGLNYLRGRVPVIGKYFMNKAERTVDKYIKPTLSKSASAK